MIKKQIRYTSIMLLLLYVGYYACVSLFVHTHIYDGVVYIHSHPYQKSEKESNAPYQTHSHTGAAFFSLNQLSTLTSNEATVYTLDEIYRPVFVVNQKCYIEACEQQSTHNSFRLRAPPILG